jgi:hypothetical protein
MDVTRTIRYEGGSYDEVMVLRRMLEDEGVHVELPRQPAELYEADVAARYSEKLRGLASRHAQEQTEMEARHREERDEIEARHYQERDEMEFRHHQERREMAVRQAEEWDELTAREGEKVNLAQNTASPLLLADVNQVVVSLMSSGSLMAITAAVKKFLNRAPNSKVEVKDEAQGQGSQSPQAPHRQLDTS